MNKYFSGAVILVVISTLLAGCVQLESNPNVSTYSPESEAPSEVIAELDRLSQTICERYDAVDLDLTRAALNMSGIPKNDTRTLNNILLELYSTYPSSYGICRVGPSGDEYVSIPYFCLNGFTEDSEFWNFDQKSFAENNTTIMLHPVHSATYGYLLHFRHPVYTPEGEYDGYVGISFLPIYLYDSPMHFLLHFENSSWYSALYEPNGLILYQPNTEVIGTNLLDLAGTKGSGIPKEMAYIMQRPSGMLEHLDYALSYSSPENHTIVWREVSIGGKNLRAALASYTPQSVPEYSGNFADFDSSVLSSLVSQMYSYARANGVDKTVAVLNDPNGQFAVDDNITLFAYNENGITLAHSQNPNAVGRSMLTARGSYNLRYINAMIDRASQGGGFIHYYVAAGDLDNGLSIFTIAYLLPIDSENTWFVGASRPIGLVQPDIVTRDQLKSDVIAFHQAIQTYGKDAVLAKLLDPEVTSQMTHSPILAVDYDGNILAVPADTSQIGRNIFGYTDPHGASSMRHMVILAKQGGGYILIETMGPDGVHVMNLVYVEPVDDTWCIASWAALDSYFSYGGDEA